MDRIPTSTVQIAVLSLWLGAALFLALTVAPALFAVLPTRTLAGIVVGRILPPIFYSGMVAGAIVLALQVIERRGWTWRGRETAGAVVIAACAIAQFFIAPRIARLREEIGGPLEALAANDWRRAAFGRLHGISVAWLGLAMIAAVIAIVFAARAGSSSTS
jgi:hypothetical protein